MQLQTQLNWNAVKINKNTYTSIYATHDIISSTNINLHSNDIVLKDEEAIPATSKYLNFFSTPGEAGIGIRMYNGTLQFKNNSGSWTNFGAGSVSGLNDLTNVSYSSGDLTITDLDNLTTSASDHDVAGTNLSIQAGNTTAGTTNNIAGGDLTLSGGQGKGTGAGGDILFKVANAGSSGSSLNNLATAVTISSTGKTVFDNVIQIKSEQSSEPTAPANGLGGNLYTKADGKLYWNSNEYSETSLLEGVISRGMTVQTQHTDFNTAVTGTDISSWAAISVTDPDATPSGYVVSITPSSSSSNVLINVNCHIGVETTNDGKYYGLRLYRRIGSGDWAHVENAGSGDNDADDSCFITNNNFSGLNSSENDIISNLSGTFLDSPIIQQILFIMLYIGKLD